jgi:prepilin-type N-terminal cleavage/methylation domain-containing protein
MDCTITSLTRKPHKVRCAGLTLVEMLVAIGISGIVFVAVGMMIFFSGRSYAALANYVDLDNKSRTALDQMSKEIRQVDCVISAATATLPVSGKVVTNQLVLRGTGIDGIQYTNTYTYNPTNQTLVQTKVGGAYAGSKTLLTGCTYLNFGMFQRVPIDGTLEQFDAADYATCKVVQLDWICSRKIFNKSDNTESIQSAKVVIRKK